MIIFCLADSWSVSDYDWSFAKVYHGLKACLKDQITIEASPVTCCKLSGNYRWIALGCNDGQIMVKVIVECVWNVKYLIFIQFLKYFIIRFVNGSIFTGKYYFYFIIVRLSSILILITTIKVWIDGNLAHLSQTDCDIIWSEIIAYYTTNTLAKSFMSNLIVSNKYIEFIIFSSLYKSLFRHFKDEILKISILVLYTCINNF